MSNGSIDQTHPEWPSLRQHMLDMGAEIDNLRREVDHLQRESAENEAELAEMTKLMERYYIDWDNADEALARVQELCQFRMRNNMDIDGPDILAAIKGKRS